LFFADIQKYILLKQDYFKCFQENIHIPTSDKVKFSDKKTKFSKISNAPTRI